MTAAAPRRPMSRRREPDCRAPRTGRILGVDAARALALVGMFATHILPLHDATTCRRSPGCSPTAAPRRCSRCWPGSGWRCPPAARGGRRTPARTWPPAAGLLVRGLLVALLGLWLIGFDSPVAVILPYYGLLFVVAVPLLRLPAPALAARAVLSCALAPVLSHLLRAGLPAGPGPQPGLAALAQPGELFTTLALTGYYPVLPWTTYLLAGMAVGRLDLRRVRVAVGLLVGGTVLAVAAVLGLPLAARAAAAGRRCSAPRRWPSATTAPPRPTAGGG